MSIAQQSPFDPVVELQRLARVGSWTSTAQSPHIQCSAELCRILGIGDAAISQPLSVLVARIHPDDAVAVTAAIEAVRRDGTAFELEHRIVRADGQTRMVESRAQVFVDAHGAREVLGVMQDVHDRNEATARAMMTDRTASIATLSAGVAHEINNPLAPMSANLEMIEADLRRRGLAGGELGAMLDELRQGVDRIHRIVRGLTMFSRANPQGRVALDLRRVMDLAIDLAGSEIRNRANLVKDYRSTPTVIANEGQLAQVFVNLLLNAVHALPEHEVTRHEIRIVTRSEGPHAVIEVHDTGRGISPADQRRIFDPFYTTRAVGGGTGLGLSICHGIVTSLGGTITVDSTPGRGTTFRVSVPAVGATVSEPVRPPTAPAANGRSGQVLIVDDEVIFGNSLRRLLSHDHAVTVATNGNQVLDSLRGGTRYDIILCDLMMPQMTGMDLHAEIETIAADQADRMVFMTGGAFTPASRKFLERMSDRWLEKPCDIPQLREIVRTHVR